MRYEGGRLAIGAVPGSGKTFILAHLAAGLVMRLSREASGPGDDREVLVVTLVNSAVNSVRSRIASIIRQERGLLPYLGYRVRTLHGLAHDIVRERPGLVGLSEDFGILDERVSAAILRDVVENWLRRHGDMLLGYLHPDVLESEAKLRHARYRSLPDLALSVAARFVGQAKDLGLTPDGLGDLLSGTKAPPPLIVFGVDVYRAYQRSLSARGAVDFDDLVRLALSALERDPDYLERLRHRWPYVLEDEAQDSSMMQNKMLELLTGGRNWVRVGDPNQAIYTTFTTANPEFLRDFMGREGVRTQPLTVSGRSARPIIDMANALVNWTCESHPVRELRDAFYPQMIRPAPPGDPQPNPPDDEAFVFIHYGPGEKITPERELQLVADSLKRWVPRNPDKTVAVLVPENNRGYQLTDLLRKRGVPYEELLRSTTATRQAASDLYTVLSYLARPTDARKLSAVYRDIWLPRHPLGGDDAQVRQVAKDIGRCRRVEDFLWPRPDSDWLADYVTARGDLDPVIVDDLDAFRAQVRIWLSATGLPIDQLILSISPDLFTEPADLALAHKIAVVLRGMAAQRPEMGLAGFCEELRIIANNERKFLGFGQADTGYEPTPGLVTVATMHAAKGLEWDRVYLMSVNTYSFPSGRLEDKYRGEPWFIRDELNLEAEALEQLEALVNRRRYVEGEASKRARIAFAAERLRLLYVGITRARRELIITWNMGRYWDSGQVNRPAEALIALWEMGYGRAGPSAR